MGRTITLLTIALLATTVAAQPTEPGIENPDTSTPATMYFHINGLQQFPINTQKPSDLYADTPGRGTASFSGCVEDPTGVTGFTDRSLHTWYGFSSPSIVEYGVDEGDKPRIHPERGLAYDVELDMETTPMFTWFLEATSPVPADAATDPDQAPGPIPQAVVRATVRQGDDVSVGNSAFNTGERVAIGESMPTDLAGPLTQENEHVKVHEQNGKYVYEFTFPLDYDKDTIVKEEGYNIRVDAFMENPHCNDPSDGSDYLFLDHARVHTSSEMRPQLAWNIMNPLYIERMHPQFVGDDLVVHTAINSPWGSYDVLGDLAYEQQLGFDIDGPSEALSLESIIVDHTLAHGPQTHFQPVMATWIWDYQADQAADGIYKVALHAQNDQQTADAYALSTFQIGEQSEVCYINEDGERVCDGDDPPSDDKESPGLPVIALIGLICLLARRK